MNSDDASKPDARRTVIEQGSEFRGTLSSSCPVDVHGVIEGEIQTPALHVSASGSVHGRARVGTVSSQGELSGEFDAERIELSGRVRDNTVIRARELLVRLGSERGKLQVIFGECELAVGDDPRQHSAVEETPAAEIHAAPSEPVAIAPVLERVETRQHSEPVRNGSSERRNGWSHPPSQPPPAS